MKEKIFICIIRISDIILSPFLVLAGIYMKLIRNYGINMFVNRMPLSRKILMKIGVFPLSDHYYDPLFQHVHTKIDSERTLTGIDYDIPGQLAYLKNFNYQKELLALPKHKTKNLEFYYHNGSYPPGDSEYLYSIIRYLKPKRILEIGSGNSTLMAINALQKNKQEDSQYNCTHTCIEPYEAGWLENTGVHVLRQTLENTDKKIFSDLEKNDILFIDSSHIIRPGGDVLTEYLEILPQLKTGVVIHIHDIFTPFEYPKEWLQQGVSFWNEQYLLEAFLSHNDSFKILGMLNYLNRIHKKELDEVFPILKEKAQNPGSFWLQKIK